MAGTYRLPAPRTAHQGKPPGRRYTEPQLSGIILASTGLAVGTTVLAWLLAAAVLRPARRDPNVLTIAVGHPEGVGRPGADSGDAVLSQIRDFLKRMGSGPAVVVLQAGAASRAGDAAPQPGAYLLVPRDAPGSAPAVLPMNDVLNVLQKRAPAGPTLLVLDCAVSAADRDLGVFGNGFLSELKPLLKDAPRVAVLTACVEGQSSWWLDGGMGTVFGHFVAKALDGGRPDDWKPFSAGELLDHVRPRVAAWVKAHRDGAVQVPELFGDRELAFRLINPSRSAERAAPGKADLPPKVDDLPREWKERARLAAQDPPPYRRAPLAWRAYQWQLLRAERLLRYGDRAGADAALRAAKDARPNSLATGLADAPAAAPWSVALLRIRRDIRDGEAQAVKYEAAAERLFELLSGVPPESVPAKAVGPSPAKEADAAPGAPPATGSAKAAGPATAATTLADALSVLTEGADGRPRYVEGQLPVWYAEFVRRGGEADTTREDRVRWLRRGFEVRERAEQAAVADPRVLALVRSLVDEGDAIRRRAQDGVFAASPEVVRVSGDELAEADKKYRKALDVVASCVAAYDLLERVQDALPDYAEWAARADSPGRAARDRSPVEWLEEVAGHATALANLAYADASTPEKLNPARGDLERSFRSLEAEFKARVRAAQTWREVDALLRVPSIELEDRESLLRRAREYSPDPGLEEVSSPPADTEQDARDERFLAEALGMARAESGLLRVAGHEVSMFGDSVDRAIYAWKHREGMANLNALSGLLVSAREAARKGSSDRAARLASGFEATDRRGNPDPARLRWEQAARDTTLWCARRLVEDFDAERAERVLTDVPDRPTSAAPGRIELAEVSKGEGPALNVSVFGRGVLPEGGRAAVFLSPDPGARVWSPARTSNLVPVVPGNESTLEFTPINVGAKPVTVTPVAFFRGRFYGASEGRLIPHTEMVKVEIHSEESIRLPLVGRSAPTAFKILDQFSLPNHQHVGYYHPNRKLGYWLSVKNTSPGRLTLHVTQDLNGMQTGTDVTLEKGQSSGRNALVGEVIGDRPEQRLVVSVREGDSQGRELCEPLKVVFREVDPGKFIVPELSLKDRVVTCHVAHLLDDPAPFPVQVTVNPQPAGALFERTRQPFILSPGKTASHEYLILNDDLKRVVFEVNINGRASPDHRKVLPLHETQDGAPGGPGAAPKPPGAPVTPATPAGPGGSTG
jgi:hypothetical protein